MRTIVFWDLYRDPHILAIYHIGILLGIMALFSFLYVFGIRGRTIGLQP